MKNWSVRRSKNAFSRLIWIAKPSVSRKKRTLAEKPKMPSDARKRRLSGLERPRKRLNRTRSRSRSERHCAKRNRNSATRRSRIKLPLLKMSSKTNRTVTVLVQHLLQLMVLPLTLLVTKESRGPSRTSQPRLLELKSSSSKVRPLQLLVKHRPPRQHLSKSKIIKKGHRRPSPSPATTRSHSVRSSKNSNSSSNNRSRRTPRWSTRRRSDLQQRPIRAMRKRQANWRPPWLKSLSLEAKMQLNTDRKERKISKRRKVLVKLLSHQIRMR